MDNSAEQINAFAALGVGELAYLRVLYHDDVKALAGPDADIKPDEFVVALIDSDGSPIALRGSIADCLLAAEEFGIAVAAVH